MLKRAFRGIGAATIILGIHLSVLPEALSQFPDFMLPDPTIWTGKITVTRNGAAHRDKLKTDGGGGSEKNVHKRTVSEKLVLEMCGTAEVLYIKNAKHSLSDITESEIASQAAETICPLTPEQMMHSFLYRNKHFKPEKKSPGNSHSNRKREKLTLYENPETPMREGGSASIRKMPGGKYFITGTHQCYIKKKADTVDETHYVCTGDVRRIENHWNTVGIGQKGNINTTSSGEGANEHSVTTVTTPPLPYLFGMYGEGIFNKKELKGFRSQSEIKGRNEGDYSEKIDANWVLKGRSPCKDVFDQLYFALDAAEAYANPTLREFADSESQSSSQAMSDYEANIRDRIRRIRTGKPFPRGDSGGSNELSMWVDKNCNLINRDKFEKKQRESCQHPIIFKAVLHHENRHIQQCWEDKTRFNNGGAAARGQAEVSAYLAQAKKLLGWLDDYCKSEGLDLTGLRARLKRLAALKAGWWD